jgi:subtilisin-like proprotein convertase family protein
MCDTQSGSSGSPVVAYSDHRVVTLHHCSGCENTGVLIQDVIADLGANLPACALDQLDGIVQLDSSFYGCSSLVGIVVRDESLVGAGTQSVSLTSSSEASPETVVLSETPPGSGTFRGSITLTTAPASAGDGLLSVSPEDTVTVVYIDADDGQGGTNVPRSDTARVDCRPPVISDLHVARATGREATIRWTTDEPATSVLRFGVAPPPAAEQSSAALVTSHELRLAGLAPCTTYLFEVRSADAAGNEAVEDGGGSFFVLSTASDQRIVRLAGDTPISIPDNSAAGASSTIQLADQVTVADVDVEVDITHPYTGDLTLSLITPGGTEILLSAMRGDDGDNYGDTRFDDEAPSSIAAGLAPFTGSFRPEQPLSLADDLVAAGDWTLKVTDLGPTDFGTLDGFTLELSYAGGCGVSAVHESSTAVDACTGTGGGGENTVVDPGESVVLPLTLRNDGTVPLTGVSVSVATATPGVVVTRAASSFPSLDPGQTGGSLAPHVALVVGTQVDCGTPIELFVQGTSDQGTFADTFELRVGTSGITTLTHRSSEVPRLIPDTLTATSSVAVTDPEVLRDVDVELSITHAYVSDLDIFLISPDGTRVELSTDNGGSGADYAGTVFDDEAAGSIVDGTAPFSGRFRREAPLAALDGMVAGGTWTLEVTDDALQDPGALTDWAVVLTSGPEASCDACSVAAPLDEVSGLVWASPARMTWSTTPQASFYSVYRGEPADLAALLDPSEDSCRRAVTATNDTGEILDEVPPSGSFAWYLVRAGNAGGEGPAGDATAGERSQNSTGDCP